MKNKYSIYSLVFIIVISVIIIQFCYCETPENYPKIVFCSRRDNPQKYQIYIMDANGKNQLRLTNNTFKDIGPSWSPDHKKILFFSDRDGNCEIYIMDADGSHQTRITNNQYDDIFPTWSPDGKKIAFSSNRGQSGGIYIINADGNGEIQLTNGVIDQEVSWMPNGKQIIFTSDCNKICRINIDGTAETTLFSNENGGIWTPHVSPDGKKIAFSTQLNGDDTYKIYVMNIDGSNLIKLTSKQWNYDPWWSPDGKKIVFTSDRDGNKEIYTMNSDGSEQTRLTYNNSWDYLSAW